MQDTNHNFSSLGLHPSLHALITAAGYINPTPVQTQAIPHVVAGRDVLCSAQTGTGKTAAFALPIVHRLLTLESERVRIRGRTTIGALVLAPTRELASQIGECFAAFERAAGLRHTVIFGGVSAERQIRALRHGVDVVIATPGRLLDLMRQGELDLTHVSTLVLDEADRMLDMGFINDVRKIVTTIPRERQTLMFSATMPQEIETLASRILTDPIRVVVDPVSSTGRPITQSVYFVENHDKLSLLANLLGDETLDRALVFTRTKHGANRVAERLARFGIRAAAIHGGKSQNARERVLSGIKLGQIRVVVATDIAARGIDIKELSHVINFELPIDPESYVHRVGRTGRAGRSGIAMSFCSMQERGALHAIERLSGKQVPRVALPASFVSKPDDGMDSRRPDFMGRDGSDRSSRSGPRGRPSSARDGSGQGRAPRRGPTVSASGNAPQGERGTTVARSGPTVTYARRRAV